MKYSDCDYEMPTIIKLNEKQQKFIVKFLKLIETDEDFQLFDTEMIHGKTFVLHVLDRLIDERLRKKAINEKLELYLDKCEKTIIPHVTKEQRETIIHS